MVLFYTPSTQHLAAHIPIQAGQATFARFADGEITCSISLTLTDQPVWVIAATRSPQSHLKLFFLLDALHRAGATTNLLFTYFGYARQDRLLHPGQAVGGQVLATIFNQFRINTIKISHAHSNRLQEFMPFEQINFTHLYAPIAAQADIIVAPDHGALPYAQELGTLTGKPVAYFEKQRNEQTITDLTFHGTVAGKKVIIVDDMVSTGATMVLASQILARLGATEIIGLATHGIFAGDAHALIEQSPISKLYVTNSLAQKASGKIKIIEIQEEITRILKKS